MFDKYMIYEPACKNVMKNGKVVGFQLGIRVAYYRSLMLTLIKDFSVTVDGVSYKKEDMLFTFNGKNYLWREMAGNTQERWWFGDVATVTVYVDGGLVPGPHEVEVMQNLRISYGLKPVYNPTVAKWKTIITF